MPKLKRAKIKELRPTQLTVGMLEVEVKRKRIAALSAEAREEYVEAHPMPAVLGPEGAIYITDHHHLARAALEAKVEEACFEIVADFSRLAVEKFWPAMDKRLWVHPLDEHGVKHCYSFIPARLDQLVDDVYRSLAGFVRDAGGFKKVDAAFVEFIWADYFRRNIAIEDVRSDFKAAVRRARHLARSPHAKRIPGYKR